MQCRDDLNFCLRKRVRLGLGEGLGLRGDLSGRLAILREKKGKVRVRVGR